MYKILIVEDDCAISLIIEEHLKKWGYEALIVEDFGNVINEFTSFEPHLVLMDINLPFFDGFYWCAKIRELSNIPIMFISSRESEGDKIRAITQGGDDYIEKPFSMDLLTAKILAMLRRAYSVTDQSLNLLQYKDIILDVEKFNVSYSDNEKDKSAETGKDKETELTKNECKILTMLIKANGNMLSRTRIMQALWEDESFVDDNTLTVNVNRLRRKLEEIGAGSYIKTIKGEGYRLI